MEENGGLSILSASSFTEKIHIEKSLQILNLYYIFCNLCKATEIKLFEVILNFLIKKSPNPLGNTGKQRKNL